MTWRAPAPPKPRLVSADTLIAGDLREQARALMTWARDLRAAELAGDWSKVALVREDIASCATSVACFASELDERARRR